MMTVHIAPSRYSPLPNAPAAQTPKTGGEAVSNSGSFLSSRINLCLSPPIPAFREIYPNATSDLKFKVRFIR